MGTRLGRFSYRLTVISVATCYCFGLFRVSLDAESPASPSLSGKVLEDSELGESDQQLNIFAALANPWGKMSRWWLGGSINTLRPGAEGGFFLEEADLPCVVAVHKGLS